MKTLLMMILALIPSVTSVFAADCKNTDLARALDRLEGKGRLHNCQIELVTRTSLQGKEYMLLVNDLTPIAAGERQPVSFEFLRNPDCSSEAQDTLSEKTIRWSYGYSAPKKDYKVAIQIQMGQGMLPTRLVIQNIDLISHAVEQRVACRLDSGEI